MKFVHLSDCHLDLPLVDLSQYQDKANQRRKELRESFSNALKIAEDFGADIILISGDLFEHKYVTKSTIEYINGEFKKIPHIDIFISPGNHDPFLNNSYYNTYKWSDNVYIFNRFEKISLQKLDTEIYGVGLNDFKVEKSMIESFKIDKDKINILITHATLNSMGSVDNYHPIEEKYLKSLELDYCALGHIHKPLVNDKNYICYSGSIEPLGFDEPGEHGIILGEITKEYRVINFKPISNREYVVKEVDITGLKSIQEISEQIKCSFSFDNNKQNFVKVYLIGNADPDIIDINELQELMEDKFYYLKIADKTWSKYLLEDLETQNNIKGLFIKSMNNLINKSSEEDQIMLNKSLQYGIAALNKSEIKL